MNAQPWSLSNCLTESGYPTLLLSPLGAVDLQKRMLHQVTPGYTMIQLRCGDTLPQTPPLMTVAPNLVVHITNTVYPAILPRSIVRSFFPSSTSLFSLSFSPNRKGIKGIAILKTTCRRRALVTIWTIITTLRHCRLVVGATTSNSTYRSK